MYIYMYIYIYIYMYEHWERLKIKVNGGNLSKSLHIGGNIYRPPRTQHEQIRKEGRKTKSKYTILHGPSKGIHSLTIKIDNTNIKKVDEFWGFPWIQI